MTRHLTCMYEGRIDGTASSGEKKCDWRGPFWKWRRRFAWNSASRSKHRPDWIWWAERERKSAGWRRNKKKKEMRMQMWSSYRSASSQFDYIAGNYQWAASLPPSGHFQGIWHQKEDRCPSSAGPTGRVHCPAPYTHRHKYTCLCKRDVDGDRAADAQQRPLLFFIWLPIESSPVSVRLN